MGYILSGWAPSAILNAVLKLPPLVYVGHWDLVLWGCRATPKSIHIDRERERESEREREREEAERQRGRETERQRDRETERQRDRETERQRDRE